MKAFEQFDAKNKICFTAKKYDAINSIQLEQYKECKCVTDDTKEKNYKKYISIYEFINTI